MRPFDRIEIRNLTKSFCLPGGRWLLAIEDLSLECENATITCIVGPSGCGKTTLLNVVASLVAPDHGTVSYVPIAHNVVLGYMFQDDRLLPWRSAIENVLLGTEIRLGKRQGFVGEAKALLRQLGLEGFENSYPSELSEGMRQRVAFARTLIVKPNLLLLDEPFSNVDYEIRLELENIVLRLCAENGTTIVVVTHDLEEAIVLGQRIVVLSRRPGRLVELLEVDTPLQERDALEMRRSEKFGQYLGHLANYVLEKRGGLNADV
jgi:NitT/TauT family transport system ATP-binding protein